MVAVSEKSSPPPDTPFGSGRRVHREVKKHPPSMTGLKTEVHVGGCNNPSLCILTPIGSSTHFSYSFPYLQHVARIAARFLILLPFNFKSDGIQTSEDTHQSLSSFRISLVRRQASVRIVSRLSPSLSLQARFYFIAVALRLPSSRRGIGTQVTVRLVSPRSS